MQIRIWSGLLTACLAFSLTAVALPAEAATTWRTGTRVSSSDVPILDFDQYTSSFKGTQDCDTDASVGVIFYGDYVYVRDDCYDGRAAVGKVTWDSAGEAIRLICRNSEGYGNWARCDWDWPEDEVKSLVAGVHNGNTGYLSWDHGRTVYFND